MNRPELTLSCLSVAVACLAACTASTSPAPAAAPAAATTATSDADLLARGDYLVRVAGCNDCHTPAYGDRGGNVPKEEWLVGSPLGFNGPWGPRTCA